MFKWLVLVLPLLLLLGALAAGAANAMPGLQASFANLSVTKTASPDPVVVGNNLTYTVTVANSGPNAATNATLTDFMPSSFSFVSATSTPGICALSGVGILTCNLGTLAIGAIATATIIGTPTAVGTLTNVASVTATEADPVLTNNTAAASTTVNSAAAQADLSVSKTESADPVTLGNNLAYTVFVTNNGPAAATGVTLTDTLLGSFTLVSATSSPGSCSGTNPINCSLGTLVNGGSATVFIVVTPTAVGNVTNTAVVTSTRTDPNSANNLATASTTVISAAAGANLSVTKTASPDPAVVGNNLTYTTIVTNSGPEQATGVVLTDNVFGNATFISALSNVGSCSGTNPITCNLFTLVSGASATITIVVIPTAAGTLTNIASVTATQADPVLTNNTATISTTVNPVAAVGADLRVTKNASPSPVTLGNNLTYTVTVTNHGPEQATGVALTDTMFGNPTFVSAVSNLGPCSGTNPIICNVGNLASGASATISIVVTANATGALTNFASVTSATTDTNPANNVATISTIVNPVAAGGADLRVTKNASPSPVTLGNILTYTVTVTNHGPEQATGVTLSDSLPQGVTFVSATPSPGSCSGTNPITCSLGTLVNGGSATVFIVVTPNAAAALTNTASVTSAVTDPNSANNLATISTTVNPVAVAGADLRVTRNASPDPVALGNNLTYTVTVTNHGPDQATGVTLTDTLLGSFTFVSATPGQGSCSGTHPITCNLGNLAAGASATLSIVVTPTREGDIINIALVKGAEPDSALMNNLAIEKARVKAATLEDTQGKIEFTGFIQSLPQTGLVGTWRIQGIAVNVTQSTEIKGTFRIGSAVKVEGILTAEGTIQAKELKAEKRDRGVRDLDDDHRPGRGLGDRNHRHDGPPGLDRDDDDDDDHHRGKGKGGRKHRRND